MAQRLYTVTRDLHLYLGLFISPFMLMFAVSVFYLVHTLAGPRPSTSEERHTATNIHLLQEITQLQGRARVEALRPVLDQLGVHGEVDFIRHIPGEHRLVIPVRVPGRETTVDLNYQQGTAVVSSRPMPLGEMLVFLHKTPGPHNADVRGNAVFMRIWRLLADATSYVMLFLTLSGIYLWAVLRAERRIGLTLLALGACTFFGLVYALAR